MAYVDVFLIPVPKARLAEYQQMSVQFADMLKAGGASDYVEYIGDDVPMGEMTSFPRAVQAKDDEVIAIGWATYPNKGVRDAANEKMRSDPNMANMEMPFDGKRMIFGGFREP
ncbi:MAG TPA: DUF1428 domain-containing protein [Caulobacteraceae bacterium]|nr:DUF1428 domain-containing protein [Caulobacteraceae bacterium]